MRSLAEKRFSFILWITLMTMLGCSNASVNTSELVGSYIAVYTQGEEKLLLNDSGEYIQEVFLKSNQEHLTAKGKWSYDAVTEQITLKNCLHIIDGFGDLRKDYSIPVSGVCVNPVVREGKTIRIGSKEGIQYRKK